MDDLFTRFQFATKASQQTTDVSSETGGEGGEMTVLRDAHAFEVAAKPVLQGADVGAQARHEPGQFMALPCAELNSGCPEVMQFRRGLD
jgi:hypothetical protein